jgi:hypothetical protein
MRNRFLPFPALAWLLASCLGLAAPAAPAQPPPLHQSLVKPIWITALPNAPGRVYAMGLAPFAPGEAQAVVQASQNARGEVLARLRANVHAETNVRSTAQVNQQTGSQATGSSQQQVDQAVRIEAQASELPGLAVEETWTDGPGRTVYALAYLDVPLAEQELRSRYQTRRSDLAREPETPAAPRERLRMLNRLKEAQSELVQLDDQAALLAAGGGDPGLRSQVRASRLAVDRQMEQLRNSLTFSLDPGSRGATQIATLLRNAVLKAGLGWAENGGEFQLVMDFSGDREHAKMDVQHKDWQWNGWWHGAWVSHTQSVDSGIIVARGVLELTLQDRAGNPYESVEVEAKGLGVSEFQAEQRLKDDLRNKLEKTFGKWLEHLVAE